VVGVARKPTETAIVGFDLGIHANVFDRQPAGKSILRLDYVEISALERTVNIDG
jgi:hypothetical protein